MELNSILDPGGAAPESGGVLLIEGGVPLRGELRVQGAKNSILPLLAASALCDGESVFHNCPELSDVAGTVRILRYLGCAVQRHGKTLVVRSGALDRADIPDRMMREMRSSIVFLGAILGKCGEASLSFPGGCEIGQRPIDLHLSALKKLGVEIREEHGLLFCRAPHGVTGGFVSLAFPSVGATENLLLAAATGRGTTVIANAAREPEIADLADFLNRCGAHIYGAGESCVIVEGVSRLAGSEFTVMPDRIAAATYMAAAAVTGGTVLLRGVKGDHLLPVLSAFEETGCRVLQSGGELLLSAPERLGPVRHIRTMPYPGFPTDAQAPIMAMAAVGKGTSIFVENIFECRYKHAAELNRLGARIKIEGKVAVVEGVPKLSGAPVTAADLRGGAALAVAGLSAEGETKLFGPKYIDRGYEHFERNLRSLGAQIVRA